MPRCAFVSVRVHAKRHIRVDCAWMLRPSPTPLHAYSTRRLLVVLTRCCVQIDATFNDFDADDSGAIDMKELQTCLLALQDAAVASEHEAASVRGIGNLSLQRAKQLNDAADTMRRIEKIEAWLGGLHGGSPQDQHPSIRFFERLTAKKGSSLNTNEFALNWKVRNARHDIALCCLACAASALRRACPHRVTECRMCVSATKSSRRVPTSTLR
jgi:hypothetical protein